MFFQLFARFVHGFVHARYGKCDSMSLNRIRQEELMCVTYNYSFL